MAFSALPVTDSGSLLCIDDHRQGAVFHPHSFVIYEVLAVGARYTRIMASRVIVIALMKAK